MDYQVAVGVMVPRLGSVSHFDKKAQKLVIKPTYTTELGSYTGSILIKNEQDDSFKNVVFLVVVLEK